MTDNIPKYISELSRIERELIVRLRSADEQEQNEIDKICQESDEELQIKKKIRSNTKVAPVKKIILLSID